MNKLHSSFIRTLQDNQELHFLLNNEFIVQTLVVRESMNTKSNFDFQFVGVLLWDLIPVAWLNLLREEGIPSEQKKTIDLQLDQNIFVLSAQRFPNHFISLVLQSGVKKQKQDLADIKQQLSLKLSGEDNLDAILSATLDACLSTSNMDSGGIYLINPDHNQLGLVYHKGLGQKFVEAVGSYPKGSDRWALVNHGTPIYLEYENLPLEKDSSLISEGIQSTAILPIRYMGRLMGCVNLASHHFTNVDSDQRSKLESIIVQVGPAINRIQLHQRLNAEGVRFQQLLDDLNGYFILVRFDGKILFVNQFLLTTLGYHSENLLNEPVFKLFHDDSNEKLQKILNNDSQDPYVIDELAILSFQGKSILVDAWVSMTSLDGEPVFALWFRKSVKKEMVSVLESAAHSLNLYDDLPVPVLYVDPTSMLVLYANQLVSDQYGYLKSEMAKKNFMQFFDSSAYHKIAKLLREFRLDEINRIVWNQVDAFGQKMRVRFFIRFIFRGNKTVYIIVPNPVISLDDDKDSVNQDRYRSVLDQQTDIILRFSPDGLITYVNQAYCDFFNKSAQEIIGTPFMEHVYANDFDIVSSHLAQLTPERPLRESKNRMWDGDKNVRWFRWIDRAIFVEDKLMEIQAVGRDITETEEEALKNINLENQFRSLIENSPAIIYFLEAKSLFPIYVNDQLEKITGYSKQEFLKDSVFWKTIIYPEDYKNWLTTMENRKTNEEPESMEFRVLAKSGQQIWLKDEGNLIEITGEGLFIEGIIIDITHQKKSEQKLAFYLALERLINQVVKKLVHTNPDSLPQTIQETLTLIGQFMDVDRSYIFYFDGIKQTVSNQYEWCAEGISHQKNNLQDIPANDLPYFYETIFINQQFLQIEDVNQLGPEATIEKSQFSQQDILSILVVPMVIHNNVIGFMGFDSVRKKYRWGEDTIALLQVVSNLIVLVESKSSPLKPV